MEGSHGGSSSPAPFLTKTYDMLEEPSTNSIVSWSQSGSSFIVWNPLDFARDLLPTYFKHNNFSSFIRQLNTYGFHKIDPERWEFANNEFIRGQKHLLKKIHRRKPIHSHAIPPQGTNLSMQLSEPERQELKEEIERLKYDKSALIIELEKHAQQQHGIHRKMQDLEDRLQGMMLNQRNLVSFLDQIVQMPGFLSSLIQPSDLQTKKRRLPKHDLFLQDAILQDGSIPALDIEPFEKMESCLNSLEMFVHEVSQASGEDTFPVIVPTNLHDASGGTNLDSTSCHEYCQSYHSLPDSPTQAESTILPEVDIGSIQTCDGSKVTDLDMNSEPAVHSKGLGMEMPVVTMPIGVNDTFWEQFLTESPGYCDLQESQSERRDGDGRSAERVVAGQGSGWWNRKSVDHLTERMGHLTSTEST